MAERRQGWPVWAIAALAAALIVAGLTMTGGPMQGRAERRDEVRMGDLDALLLQADCRAGELGELTTDLAPTAACPATPRAADPFTDEPYQVEIVDAHNLRLCAGFELPLEDRVRWGRREGVDAGDGCMVYLMPEPLRPAPGI